MHRYKHDPVESQTLEDDLVENFKTDLKILPDFIVISGDISFQAVKGGFIEAEKFLLNLRAWDWFSLMQSLEPECTRVYKDQQCQKSLLLM